MKLGKLFAVALIGAAVASALFALSAARTYAYAVGGGSTSQSGSQSIAQPLDNLTGPFQSFFQSLGAMWGSNSGSGVAVPPAYMQNVSIPTSWGSSLLTSGAQSAAQSFDNWLYGILGFHIATLIVAILNIFVWILGMLQGAASWLLGVFK